MAASSRDAITQRLAIEGAQDVLRQLQQLGKAGEDAFRQLQNAADASNAGLSNVSTVSARLQTAFVASREAVGSIGESFTALGQNLTHFRDTFTEVADRVIPHFREVAVLATGAGVAGFVSLAREAARAATEIDITSRELGIPTQRLQGLAGAANAVGVETKELFSGLLRLSKQIAQVAIENRDKVLELGSQITQGIQVQGVAVIRGVQNAAGEGLSIIRGRGQQTQQIYNNLGENFKAVLPLAIRVRSEAEDALKAVNLPTNTLPTVQQLQTAFSKLLETNDQFRQQARDLGVVAPFKTLAEVLLDARDAGNDLGKMFKQLGIPLIDLATGKRKSLDEALVDFANRFDHAQDRSKAALQAFRLFGDQYEKILPVLAKGGAEFDRTAATLTKLGLGFSAGDLKIGQELLKAFSTFETAVKGASNTIALAFAPALQPALEGLTELIRQNAFVVKGWADDLSNRVAPAVRDLLGVIQGNPAQTEVIKAVVSALNTLRVVGGAAATVLTTAFAVISAGLTPVAGILNFVVRAAQGLFGIVNDFGTEFTGQGLALALAIGQVTGSFKLFGAAIGVVDAALHAFVTGPLSLLARGLIFAAGLVGWPAVLLAGLVAVSAYFIDFSQAWENFRGVVSAVAEVLKGIVQLFSGPFNEGVQAVISLINGDFAGAFDHLKNAIGGAFAAFGQVLSAFQSGAIAAFTQLFAAFPSTIGDAFKRGMDLAVYWVNYGIGYIGQALDALWQKIKSVGAALASVFSGGGSGSVEILAPAAATGGLIRGPGTGTSDDVLLWASNGEHITNAAATRRNLPLLQMINAGVDMRALFDRLGVSLRGFADGGLVSSLALPSPSSFGPSSSSLFALAAGSPGGNKTPINLFIDRGKALRMFADQNVADRLLKEAKQAKLLSTGRSPSWRGS
jgi:hypothetical protein